MHLPKIRQPHDPCHTIEFSISLAAKLSYTVDRLTENSPNQTRQIKNLDQHADIFNWECLQRDFFHYIYNIRLLRMINRRVYYRSRPQRVLLYEHICTWSRSQAKLIRLQKSLIDIAKTNSIK